MKALAATIASGLLLGSFAQAAESTIGLSEAWVPASAAGKDVPLAMVVRNAGHEDAVLRARCNVANFAEIHTVDHGEGFPAMRVVRSIPVAAEGETRMNADTFHVMLLQTTRPLADGESFSCAVTFRDAGRQDVTVTVGQPN